jgi:hypothetical protein
MPSHKQTEAARRNIKKAQAAWRGMSHRQRALAQPEGRARARPGKRGGGRYYRVEVRPKREFATFRYHDVGRPGHALRLAGRRTSGSWADVAWLISKDDAHVAGGYLVADTAAARGVLAVIGPARHVEGDIFQGHPRKNIPEREKPTAAQRRARTANIRKAQAARHMRRA